MIISIIGTNGMLSTYLSRYFYETEGVTLNLYGVEKPNGYKYSNYKYIDLLKSELNYKELILSDIIIYAAGAGVQAAVNTSSDLMYKLNLLVPIHLCNKLNEYHYNGYYISFGSYMEVGINNDETILFDEKKIELSTLSVSNDYCLSKRLLTRYMGSLSTPFTFWHFILPNMFVKNEEGNRLIPYVVESLKKISRGEESAPFSFSSGTQIRQYINLSEVCEVITKSYDLSLSSGIYNIGGGEILTVKNLIIRMFNFYNVPISDDYFGKEIRRDGDIKCLKIDGTKLFNAIKFLPNTKIESIL
jgi:UDP-glucose 4-epimerase